VPRATSWVGSVTTSWLGAAVSDRPLPLLSAVSEILLAMVVEAPPA
jgi:hypothetical protein